MSSNSDFLFLGAAGGAVLAVVVCLLGHYHDPPALKSDTGFCEKELNKWQSKYQTLIFDSGCNYDDANVVHCPGDLE